MANLPDRADDERLLRVLTLRMAGADLATCAATEGMTMAAISKMVSRTRLADIQECDYWGDKPKEVAAQWRPTIARAGRAIMAGGKTRR